VGAQSASSGSNSDHIFARMFGVEVEVGRKWREIWILYLQQLLLIIK
jgi:hypothetical protein